LRYRVYKVFESLPAVTLTFDHLTAKSNQHIYDSNRSVTQDWANFP